MRKPPFDRLFSLGRRPRLSLAAFRDEVGRAIAAASPNSIITSFDDDGLEVADQPGVSTSTSTVHVARVHALYCADPDDKERLIGSIVVAVAGDDRKIALEDLMILVRRGAELLEPEMLLTRPLVADLWAAVAAVGTDSIRFPSSTPLREQLSLGASRIWDLALANTRDRLGPFELPSPGSVSFVTTEYGHAASYLADEDLWLRVDDEADEGVLVVPLEKHVICVMAGFSPELAPAVREMTAISEASPDRLSPIALTRVDGHWIEASKIDRAFDPDQSKH